MVVPLSGRRMSRRRVAVRKWKRSGRNAWRERDGRRRVLDRRAMVSRTHDVTAIPRRSVTRVHASVPAYRRNVSAVYRGNLCQQDDRAQAERVRIKTRPCTLKTTHEHRIITGRRDQYFFNLFSHPIFLSTRLPIVVVVVVTHVPSVFSVHMCVCLSLGGPRRRRAIRVGHRCWRPGASTATGTAGHTHAHGDSHDVFPESKYRPNRPIRFETRRQPVFPESPLTRRSLSSDKIKMFIINRPPARVRNGYVTTTKRRPTRIPNVPHTTHSAGRIAPRHWTRKKKSIARVSDGARAFGTTVYYKKKKTLSPRLIATISHDSFILTTHRFRVKLESSFFHNILADVLHEDLKSFRFSVHASSPTTENTLIGTDGATGYHRPITTVVMKKASYCGVVWINTILLVWNVENQSKSVDTWHSRSACPNTAFDNTTIPRVNEVEYLGLLIDKTLVHNSKINANYSTIVSILSNLFWNPIVFSCTNVYFNLCDSTALFFEMLLNLQTPGTFQPIYACARLLIFSSMLPITQYIIIYNYYTICIYH